MQYLVQRGKQQPKLAYLYALIGNILMAIMQILFKYATRVLSPFYVLTIRSGILVGVNLFVLRYLGEPPDVKPSVTFKMVVTRISVVSAASSLMFYCLTYIPVSTVLTLFNTGPIFIFFIQALAYNKPLNRINLLLALLSFSGVTLILQPQLLFGHRQSLVDNFYFYVLLMMISAFSNALNLHFIHGLAKTIHPVVNMYYSHIGFLLLNALISNIYPTEVQTHFSLQLIVILVLIIICAFVAQFFIYLSSSIIQPSLVMPIGYVSVMCGFIGDLYLFNTKFELLPILGIILTSSGLLSGYLASQTKQTQILQNQKQQSVLNSQNNQK